MRRKQNFEMGRGKYYFTVKSGQQNITISREDKEAAKRAYLQYLNIGKSCEWLGKWDGKQFQESADPA